MADEQLSPAPHPLAKPGYGKRSAPGQQPPSASDFTQLPPRERSIAGYIDRLTDGSDISYKTLAEVLPLYGQRAVSTALNNLVRAGHLRRGREQLVSASGTEHWVTRTWWSRTARDDDWWAAFQRGDVPEDTPPRRQTRSRAFILLAALGREAPMMALSDAECAALAPLVTEWFDRGADERHLMHALTAGLPSRVHRPFALARTRLTGKIPPVPIRTDPPPRRVLECARCGGPARPEALVAGECAACRGQAPPPPRTALPPAQVHARAAQARAAATRGLEGSHV
ncbi:hypothetical protein ACFT5C_08930 [Streptomyces sp. NPDC057116]|uniref:hypothetical protein n=1 Tax=Streptomyces sp. NPDC057116 TaxID=3346023 RepID=UPI00362C3E59